MIRPLLALLLLPLLSLSACSEGVTGKVVGIADGDTITILTAEKRQVKIRLDDIDSPEKGQEYGQKAKEALSSLIGKKTVRVEISKKDRYGRSIANVYQGDIHVNRWMVDSGFAWHYLKYSKDAALAAAEADARTNEVFGLATRLCRLGSSES